jgi:hypothetical protein
MDVMERGLDSILIFPAQNVDLLVRKPPTFSVCGAEINISGFLKPNTAAGKASFS